jgi:hypothetical protein
VQHHRRMEVLGVLAVLLVVGFLIARSKGSSAKKEPPRQAVQPPKPTSPVDAQNLVARRPPKAAAKRAEDTGMPDYGSTQGPVTDDTGVPDYGSKGNFSFMRSGAVQRAHEAVGPIPYVPPPQIPGRIHAKVIDVSGTHTRAVAGAGNFQDVMSRLPMGPVFVTMRLEPNEANPYGISAYVDGVHVGYLGTDWTKADKSVRFMTRLDEAGILPRFQGLHRIESGPNGDWHLVNFDYPGKNDGRLGDISRRIIEENGPPPK